MHLLALRASTAAFALAVAGCGARTPLELPSPDASLADAAGPDATRDQAGPATCADAGLAGPSVCAAAVQPGSPAPMGGYYSTRNNLSSVAAPARPQPAWTIQLPGGAEPGETVVDASGRIYVTFDDVPQGGGVDTLAAIEPDGTMAWSVPFADGVQRLFVGQDGRLRAAAGASPRTLVALDASGSETALGTLPANAFGSLAVGADGSLYTEIVDFRNPDRIDKLSPTGSPVWESPALDDGTCGGCVSEVALTADQHALVAALTGPAPRQTTVYALDTSGQVTWQRDFDGIFLSGPVVAPDGTLRILVASMTTSTTVLYALTAAGDVSWTTDLMDGYGNVGGEPLAVGVDGMVIARSANRVHGIDSSGVVRWRMPFPGAGTYAVAIDPFGTAVMLAGGILGLDAKTGTQLWELVGPGFDGGTLFFPSNAVMGGCRSVLGETYGGALYLGRDP